VARTEEALKLPGDLGQVLVLAGGDVVPDRGDRLACGRVDVTEPGPGFPLGPPVSQRHSAPTVAAQTAGASAAG